MNLDLNYHPVHDYRYPNEPEGNLSQNITRHTNGNVQKKI